MGVGSNNDSISALRQREGKTIKKQSNTENDILRTKCKRNSCFFLLGSLLFAGEHCSINSTQCVSGAYETGEMAAKEIIEGNLINCVCRKPYDADK
jgi:hypothetical protein